MTSLGDERTSLGEKQYDYFSMVFFGYGTDYDIDLRSQPINR
jgi:hypothetical protein